MEPQRKPSVVDTTLHTCHPCRRTIPYRIYAVFHTCGIIALMYHHVHSLLTENTTLITCLLLLSDIVLACMWATTTSLRLNPVHRTEYPEKYAAKPEDFPKLDVFICTADPYKEPPVMVVNTVLSVMAYDYPPDKISVYVSDDGGSSLTLFALMEAAKFSKHWLPFCKKNNVQDRSPEVYFSSKSRSRSDEAEHIKLMYEDMKSRVEHVVESGKVNPAFITCDQYCGVFDLWTDKFITRHDHPTIIQVLQNSKTDMDNTKKHMMPNLIYVSREKSKVSPHHFKAGALNTLIRVSGVMTNSPIILTLDCDMYSNDPATPVRALCYLTDPKIKSSLGYVQFPQKFLRISKNDIYGCESKRLFNINMVGCDGLMGPSHVGTGCFFNRRAFYGPPSKLILPEIDELRPYWIADKSIKAQDVLALTHNVAGCVYEYNTNWGSKIGFRYGSLVEDYYTGFMLHCEGWRSIFCNPKRAAFYGDSPKCLTDVLGQQKRWAVGLLEILLSKYSPIIYGFRSLGLMALGYCNSPFRPSWSIPLTVYGILPQLALIYGVSVFPKASDPWFWLYIFLFFGAYAQDLSDFLLEGGTYRKWWNDQRMLMIKGLSSFFFGFIEFTLKTLNLSTPKFDVTSKTNDDDEQRKRYEQEIFDFGTSSSMFLPLTMVAIVNLLAFVWGLYGMLLCSEGLVLELMLASFVVVNCLPVYEAIVLRKDDGKLTRRICFLAGILTFALIVSGYFFIK